MYGQPADPANFDILMEPITICMRPGTRKRRTRVSIWDILHGSWKAGLFRLFCATSYGRAADFDIPPTDRDRDALHTKEAIVNV